MSLVPFPGRVDEAIPLSRAQLGPAHMEAARRALESGWFILGDECRRFEAELATYFGAGEAILVANGTCAITLALLALGVKPGDEVIVPSLTAFPTAEAVYDAGAEAIYAEVDELGGLDVDHVQALVGPRTVGIIPVHLWGQPVALEPLLGLAREKGLFLLEDACQAHGSRVGERRAGTFGVAAALSFYPSKNLTVFGDGGAVLTGDGEVGRKVRLLRDHGRRDRYVHDVIGKNARFNEVQAALGRVSLAGLDAGNERRRELARRYRERLAGIPGVRVFQDRPGTTPVHHLFVVALEGRDRVAERLRAASIATGVHYPVPCHLQPAVVSARGVQPALPRTERICGEILSLPMFPDLWDHDVDRVVAELSRAVAEQP